MNEGLVDITEQPRRALSLHTGIELVFTYSQGPPCLRVRQMSHHWSRNGASGRRYGRHVRFSIRNLLQQVRILILRLLSNAICASITPHPNLMLPACGNVQT